MSVLCPESFALAHLRFTVPNTQDHDPKVWKTAYLTGIEGIPWHCDHALGDSQFSIGRQIDESGKLNIVWPSSSLGPLCLSSTSLRITDAPYSLPIEIARGTVCRLKSQADEWQRLGLRAPESFGVTADKALDAFLRGLTVRNDERAQAALAQQAIDFALEASVILVDAFSKQALETRRQSEGRLATLLGCELTPDTKIKRKGDALRTAFNTAAISADFGAVEAMSGGGDFSVFDEQIEWASANDQKVCVGPIVDFRREKLPQWLTLLDDSFESILSTACKHVEAVVERYRGKVHLWNCASGINIPNRLGWNDEEILRCAVSMIETVRRADERTPVLLTVSQPWSEYLRHEANGISPLHFADALIRADLGLNGLGLEFNFDTYPDGCFPRDPIEIGKQVDRWAMQGLPLMVTLSMPDHRNTLDTSRVSSWGMPASQESAETPGASVLPPESILQLLLSKPSVHAIVWRQGDEHTSSTNLWSKDGHAQPLLTHIAKLRRTFLH